METEKTASKTMSGLSVNEDTNCSANFIRRENEGGFTDAEYQWAETDRSACEMRPFEIRVRPPAVGPIRAVR